MLKLELNKYVKVRPLFKTLEYNLGIEAILSGKVQGDVYVDDLENPRTACMFDGVHHFYMGGSEKNQDFNSSLSKLIINYIFPTIKNEGKEVDYFFFYDDSSEWEKELEIALKDIYPGRTYRRYYNFYAGDAVANPDMLEGFKLKKVDSELMESTDLNNVEEIQQWTSTESWSGKDDFLENGFGFCIIKDKDIVSWCMADHVFNSNCEIGVETDEDYRERGLATRVVSACVDYCLSKGMERIGWSCFDSNEASYALAEKVGFKMYKKYPVLFGWYNSYDNLFVQGDVSTKEGNYEKGAQLFEKALTLAEAEDDDFKRSRISNKDSVCWAYFLAARAHSLSGNTDKCISRLKKGFELGLPNKDMLNDSAFDAVRDNEEFKQL